MWAYCDSSALVKRYVHEPGRQMLMQLLRRRSCVSSALLPVELRGAFRRRVSDATLDASQLSILLERLAEDRLRWTLVSIRREILTAAETLVGNHPIRALDAIHVASAQLFASRVSAPVMFLSADRKQTEVVGGRTCREAHQVTEGLGQKFWPTGMRRRMAAGLSAGRSALIMSSLR